jgi:hypothetical protein
MDNNTIVRISVESCIYGWKIDFKIDLMISILAIYCMAIERQAAQNNPSRFPNSFFRGKFSFQLISHSHDCCALSLVLCAQ